MAQFPKTERNRVKRKPARGNYDAETIYQILDEALISYVGFGEENQPFIIPTNYGRLENTLYFHGAKVSRLLLHIQSGRPLCISTALLDGIVFARTVFDHSMNYRSVTVFGRGRLVETDEEKLLALRIITEHIAKGRWKDARQPNQKELDATLVAAVEIESASAKVRSGPPVDAEEDYNLPVWAGVLPLRLEAQTPEVDPTQSEPLPLPDYIGTYRR